MTCKYTLFPFKGWAIRPNDANSTILTIDCQFLTLTILMSAEGFKLNQVQMERESTPFAEPSCWLSLKHFKEYLVMIGLNIFPEPDAHAYLDRVSPKHFEMEHHTYKAIALCCETHHFRHSSQNLLENNRTMFFEFREINRSDDSSLDAEFFEVKVTPLEVLVQKEETPEGNLEEAPKEPSDKIDASISDEPQVSEVCIAITPTTFPFQFLSWALSVSRRRLAHIGKQKIKETEN